nr:hypothetical protein [Zea mays]
MSEPFMNWLGMGATIPARIQPGSIDHVPFPTVVPCLGASFFGFTIKPLPPFLSSRPFTHEDRRMYVRLRLPVQKNWREYIMAGSVTWANQPSSKKNCAMPPPDYPYRAKELPGDPQGCSTSGRYLLASCRRFKDRPTPHLHAQVPTKCSVGRTFIIAFGLMCLP